MRVVVAPDEFGGTLSAVDAANAIRTGWLRTAPDDELVLRPVSDGGPGFVGVLHTSLGGRLLGRDVTGPDGRSVPARLLLVGEVAYVESAQAAGRALLAEPDPMGATSRGVGELIAAAVDAGARLVVVGLGGTCTTDGGAGLLSALGARPGPGDPPDALVRGGGGLGSVTSVDLGPALDRLAGVELVLASDVDSPLLGPRGAALGFGPQKGASPEQAGELEAALGRFAGLVGRRPDGKDAAVVLGAGAAGGMGFALLALGAVRVPGIRLVLDAIGLGEQLSTADLVVTGEGSFDWQSLQGKVVTGVAGMALEHGRPVLVLAGQARLARRDFGPIGVSAALSVSELLGSVDAALSDPAGGLSALAQRAAVTWSRR